MNAIITSIKSFLRVNPSQKEKMNEMDLIGPAKVQQIYHSISKLAEKMKKAWERQANQCRNNHEQIDLINLTESIYGTEHAVRIYFFEPFCKNYQEIRKLSGKFFERIDPNPEVCENFYAKFNIQTEQDGQVKENQFDQTQCVRVYSNIASYWETIVINCANQIAAVSSP